MPGTLSKGTLFPAQLTNEMFNLVNGKSSLAKLSGAKPLPFNGTELFTFNFDKEIDVVAENGAKSNGGATVTPITITPIKFEYGMRVSDEFKYASEEIRLEYLRAFRDGFAAKLARGLDICAMHGVNPRTKAASTVIGTNHFDSKATQTVTYTAADANANVEAAIGLITGAEHEATGFAMSPAFRSALAAQKKTSGDYLFPELSWGGAPDAIRGLPVDVNSTVSFGTAVADHGIIGNFRDYFRWGFAKDVKFEVIEYGNPDNDATAGDLKGHNQVYLRGEAYIGWGILVPNAFARIIPGT